MVKIRKSSPHVWLFEISWRHSPKIQEKTLWRPLSHEPSYKSLQQKLANWIQQCIKIINHNQVWCSKLNPYNRILFGNRRNELSSHEKKWRTLTCILLTERSQSVKLTCSMSPFIWHSWKENCITSKNCLMDGGEGIARRTDKWVEPRRFLGQWNYFVWYCNGGYITFICQNPWNSKNEPYCKLWILVNISILVLNCNKCTT